MRRDKFASSVLGDIPMNVAANYFNNVKRAGWQTPQQEKTAASDEELKEKGRERAVTNLSAEAHRDRGRRGERIGDIVGSAVGAAGGAMLGKTPVTRAAGGALGYMVGSKAGRTAGQEVDMKKNASALAKAEDVARRFVGAMPAPQKKRDWSGFGRTVSNAVSSNKDMLMPAAIGSALGAGTTALSAGLTDKVDSSGKLLRDDIDKSGPIGRFALRNPEVVGGLAGAANGVITHRLMTTPMSKNKRNAMLYGPLAASVALGVADKQLKRSETADKTAASRIGKLVNRSAELVTGSKAKNLVRKSSDHLNKARGVATEGTWMSEAVPKGGRAAWMKQHGPGIARKFERHMDASRGYGDRAVGELNKVKATRKAVGGVAAAGTIAASRAGLKGRREKYDKQENKLKNKRSKTASQFLDGLHKIGYTGAPEQDAAPYDEESSDRQLPAEQASMAQGHQQHPMMTNPPNHQRYQPQNYLGAELAAQSMQQQTEAGFYKQRAEEAEANAASLQDQMGSIQMQMDQLGQQVAQSSQAINDANQMASQAQDQALNQATLAARMRMGMQSLRAQMMEIASQDPEQLAAAAGGPTPQDVGNQMMAEGGGSGLPQDQATPGGEAQPGTPEAAPSPGTAPQNAPEGSGGPEQEQPSAPADGQPQATDTAEPTQKVGNMMQQVKGIAPFMVAGAGIGGVRQLMKGRDVESLSDQLQGLRGTEEETFARAAEIAALQGQLSDAEMSRHSPVRAALKGAARGASTGMAVGGVVNRIGTNLGRLNKNLNQIRGV